MHLAVDPRRVAASVVLTALLPLTACSRGEAGESKAAGRETGASAATAAPERPPNVVVYLVDTLRARCLGVYGHERDTSPAIDAFGADAAVFDQAAAQAPWTLPSVTSLFTAIYPTSHQVTNNFESVGEQAETMVEFLRARGYRTAGFVCNTLGGKGAGLDQGYDEFHERRPVRDLAPEGHAANEAWFEQLYRWAGTVDADGEQPLFLYVHTAEPHNPWSGTPNSRPPWFEGTAEERDRINAALLEQRVLAGQDSLGKLDAAGKERLAALNAEVEAAASRAHDLYDGDVRLADDHFGRLVDILRGRPGWERTVVFLVSDHGEELNDHGRWFHGQSLYQELVHVPFLVRVPGLTDGGLRLQQPVQLIDVLPTLAELVGAPADPAWQGRSVLPALRAARDGGTAGEPRPVYAMRMTVDQNPGGATEELDTALIEDGWKVIVHHRGQRIRLFDVRPGPGGDPWEQVDLAGRDPDRAHAMLATVQQFLRDLPRLDLRRTDDASDPEQQERREHLVELGYIEGNR